MPNQQENQKTVPSAEIRREGGEDVLYIDYSKENYVPSLVEQPEVMERTVDALIENPSASRIVFSQQKNYNYDFEETTTLQEIAQLYVSLLKQEKILSYRKLVKANQSSFKKRYNDLFSFLFQLKQDPITAYHSIRGYLFEAKARVDNLSGHYKMDQISYVNLLDDIIGRLKSTKLIEFVSNELKNYSPGDRSIYYRVFKPDIIPSFSFTRIISDFPNDAEIIKQYEIKNDDYDISTVTILKVKDDSKYVYHLTPPESVLKEDHNDLLNLARGVLIEHQPKAEEFTDVQRTRKVFFNIARDLIGDLAESKGLNVNYSDLNKLATILVRNTIGFGVVEILLQDTHAQDISLNSPISQVPIYVKLADYDECTSNILPSHEDANSWAAKFRMLSGSPLDEANPILDTQLEIGTLRARIAIIQEPLSPDGLAYSIRRHREDPWTLSLFIENHMLNSLAAGLLSFLIDGSRTLLVAGTRSSGKTSLLGSLLQEILSKYRIICVEDTLELPVESLRNLKYNIIRMKVRSALLKSNTGVGAAEGIRTSLRLGDSALIVGEVRSKEAKALYEAMRVGALANVVAGTIHGASPYGVFDRVVNDLGVPATSFKATDIIVVCNPVKSADGLHSWRRVVRISEIRKHWEEDPVAEGGFVDLMKYNVEKDELEPTDALMNGDSEIIKEIAGGIKGWAGNWDAVYDNIQLRGKIKKELVEYSKKIGSKEILEAGFNTFSNHIFHKISEEISQEKGLALSEDVFPRWKEEIEKELENKGYDI
jgi:archaeal flagellar protein FlaI